MAIFFFNNALSLEVFAAAAGSRPDSEEKARWFGR
jgi:hypothetical protein